MDRLIRKSAYGRTQLFLPSSSCIVREVKTLGGVVRHDRANVYHLLPSCIQKGTSSVCWHCCDPIEGDVFPIPRCYDSSEKAFHVFGATCSPNCAKAYILEHTSFDRGQHLVVLTRMLRDVYDITEIIHETPPRAALKRFGGVFDTSSSLQRKVRCALVEPPFVSYCMLAEERLAAGSEDTSLPAPAPMVEEEQDTFQEPEPPPLFDAFMKDREDGPVVAPPAPTPKRAAKRPSAGASSSTGPMSKFMKN